MRLSSDKKQKLFNAIHENVCKIRVDLNLSANYNADLDNALAAVVQEIWSEQRVILGLDEGS